MSMDHQDVKYFGFTASDYFTSPAPSGERLQVFELYSGVASIHKAAVRAGKTSATFDHEADKRQDMLTKEGFQMALNCVLRIEKDGLFTCAPHCGSFITACAANHKRSEVNDFMGDLDRAFVQKGNNIATATAFLLMVASVRGVLCVLENPPSSRIFKFPVMKYVVKSFWFDWPAIVHRCGYSTEPLGKRIGKQYKFVANFEHIGMVQI